MHSKSYLKSYKISLLEVKELCQKENMLILDVYSITSYNGKELEMKLHEKSRNNGGKYLTMYP